MKLAPRWRVSVLACMLVLGACTSSHPYSTADRPVQAPQALLHRSAVSLAVPASFSRASTPAAATPPLWIIHESVIKQLVTSGLMSTTQLQKLFGNQRTYIIYEKGDTTQIVTGAIGTIAFTSMQALGPAMKSGLPTWAKAVLFDIERWSMTPLPEQQHPDGDMAAAAQLVHKAHLLFIAAPAPDLTTTVLPHYHGGGGCPYLTNYCGYLLKLELAAHAAQVSNAIDIQGQQIQAPNPGMFTKFVQAAAAQARKAKPSVIVMEGLTTHPKATINANLLIDSYKSVRPYVQGYWLNVDATQAAMAAQFLTWILSQYP